MQARLWSNQARSRRERKVSGRAASSLWAVPDPCSGIRKSLARFVEFRVESAPPFEYSPAASGPCAPPEGFCEGCQRIAARAAFGRRFESRQLQFHNTAFSKASGSLISIQPKIQQLLSDDPRAQKMSDSNRSLARVESKTARAGPHMRSASKPSPTIGRMSRSLEAGLAVTKRPQTKTRRSCPLSAASRIVICCRGKRQTSRGRNSEARFELIPVGNVHAGRPVLRQRSTRAAQPNDRKWIAFRLPHGDSASFAWPPITTPWEFLGVIEPRTAPGAKMYPNGSNAAL